MGIKWLLETVEKAEILALTFKKVHSSENLSEEARQCRIRTIIKNNNKICGIVERAAMSGDP